MNDKTMEDTELNDILNKVLKELDENQEKITECDIRTKINDIKKGEEVKPTAELTAEAMAFGFCEYSKESEQGNESYFGPLVVWKNKDGSTVESPSIADITPNMIKYWENRVIESKNPIMRTRYAGLVWEFSKKVTGNNANHEIARIYIENILNIAKSNLHNSKTDVIKKLERAISISISLNDDSLIEKTKKTIMEYEDNVAEDSKAGLWGFSFDLIVENEKANATTVEKDLIIKKLEERFCRLSVKKDDPWKCESAAIRLARYYRRNGKTEDMRRVINSLGSVFNRACTNADPLLASSWLQHMHTVYINFNMNKEADVVSKQIGEIGPSVKESMKTISHTMNITNEELDTYVADMTKGSTEEVIQLIVSHFISRRESIETQLFDLAKKNPLTFMLKKTIQDYDGRPVATIGSLEDDLEGNVVHQISQNIVFSAPFLRAVLDAFLNKHKLDHEKLTEIVFKSPIFDTKKKEIIKSGLKAYCESNYITCIHLLIPQLEAAIRRVIELSNGVVLKKNRQGGLQLKTFDELLRDKIVENCIGKDASLYFRVIYTDQRGWNLRNDVCHGISPANTFTNMTADVVFHSLLCIAQVKEKSTKLP